MSSDKKSMAVLFAGTILFGFGIAFREAFNPWLSNTFAALVVLLCSWSFLKKKKEDLFSFKSSMVLMAIAMAALMVVATHISFTMACNIMPGLEGQVRSLYADIAHRIPGPFFTVILILIVVVAEELLWRGVAMDLCRKRYGPVASGILVVALYALPQLIGGNWILIAAAVIAGGLFTVQRLLFGGLTAPMVTHGIWSSCIFCLLPLVR